MVGRALGLLALLAAGAAQAAEPPAVIDVLAPATAPRCEPSEEDEIVVCAERPGDEYRIDPAVLAVSRQIEQPADRRKPAHHSAGKESCVPHGTNGCPGQGVIPVTAIALKALQVGVLAAKGEDWRAPLRTSPDQYRLYTQAKAKSGGAKRISIGVGVGAQPVRDPRPGH